MEEFVNDLAFWWLCQRIIMFFPITPSAISAFVWTLSILFKEQIHEIWLSKWSSGLACVHLGKVNNFADDKRTSTCASRIFLFLLCIRPSWDMVNNHSWHVLSPMTATIEMGSWQYVLLRSDGGPVFVDPFAEVCCSSYVLSQLMR
jgi:hypothetical protein